MHTRPLAVRDPSLVELHAAGAITRRRTDRRPFSTRPVPDATCHDLIIAAETQGAHVHLVDDDHVAVLTFTAIKAGALQLSDPDYRAELADWTHRPPSSGEGVATGSTVRAVPRLVPVRDYAPFGGETLRPGREHDRGARYLLIYTDSDTPHAWLRAGEALSAMLLAAVTAGLSSAPISDITELPATRNQLRTLLPGLGHPQVAVRVGYPPPGQAPPPSTRRPAEDAITPRH